MIGIDIHEPQSLEEAFALLGGDETTARPMGGGTALMLMMKARIFQPSALVSIARIDPRFHGVTLAADGGALTIGAMTTFTALERDSLVGEHLPVIREVMANLANPRVRNVASVGGNLAHADPHLDLPPVWLSLDSTVRTIGPAGERSFPLANLFAGYYETTLRPCELIMQIHVPVVPGWRRRYVKITTRSAHDWPAVGIAIGLRLQDELCEDVRIVLSAATDRPLRLHAAEDALRGRGLTAPVLDEVSEAAAGETRIESDDRGSGEYKVHLLKVHLKRALRELGE